MSCGYKMSVEDEQQEQSIAEDLVMTTYKIIRRGAGDIAQQVLWFLVETLVYVY